MAIVRCNKCALLAEQPETFANQRIVCPGCGAEATVYPTLFFIEKLLDKYFTAQREVIRLSSANKPAVQPAAESATASAALADLDLSNTDALATKLQHGPIHDWFRKKQIKVEANLRGVDTTGFFDEVAMSIGGDPTLLKEVVERIRWAQQKDHSSTTIPLNKRSPAEIQAISAFCQQLYDFSFVAKCFHNRTENNVRLILQSAPGIRTFFNGEWLEWFALMTALTYARERNKRFSCARNLSITLQNDDSHELDVFMLIDGKTPVCIECKTGEFRQNIDKYLSLRKRLGLDGKQFIMCIVGLSDEHAKGLSAMYDLSFVSERELAAHLTRLF